MDLKNIYIKYNSQDIPTDFINKATNKVFKKDDLVYLQVYDSVHYVSLKDKNYDIYNKIYERIEECYEDYIKKLDLNNLRKINLEYNEEISKYVIINGKHNISIILLNKYLNIDNIYKNFNIIYPNTVINKIKNKIKASTTTKFYNGWNNKRKNLYGYHSINIHNINIDGQRTPKMRIKEIVKHYNFHDKTVLDLGCNIGGMLLHLPKIKKGIGIDYDVKCIECGTYITNILKFNDLHFYKYDLNNYSINKHIKDLNIEKLDIIFLLSLGSWVKNWKKLYIESVKCSNTILLETNNDTEGVEQIKLFKELNCEINVISTNSYDDKTKNYSRKLYLIKNNYN